MDEFFLNESRELCKNSITKFKDSLSAYLYVLILNGYGDIVRTQPDDGVFEARFTLSDEEIDHFGLKADVGGFLDVSIIEDEHGFVYSII